jgi:N-acetyl-gamma-glutamyl-phosphate reductase
VDKLRIAILGASGYTGAELIRLLARNPHAEISTLTADRQAGKTLGEVFPHLGRLNLPALSRIEDQDWSGIDLVFAALPHGMTQEVVAALPRHLRIVDLSADFRLRDPAIYAQWYGHEHRALDLQSEAVYGLTELARDKVRGARLVANPGCYPTAAQLPLIPLLNARQIEREGIVIDAKSGVSGAGRDAKQANLYTEVSEGIHAYGIASHRHAPEIEQGLSDAAGMPMIVTFTPHLMPMNRGILATTYVRLANGASVSDLRATLEQAYGSERFVRVLTEGVTPSTRQVKGSNCCVMNVFPDRAAGRAIIISAIDNLVKGASGQAIQNMNVMYGFDEAMALEQEPLFP